MCNLSIILLLLFGVSVGGNIVFYLRNKALKDKIDILKKENKCFRIHIFSDADFGV